jgi:tetratricopeptide (TPR) repeat protein
MSVVASSTAASTPVRFLSTSEVLKIVDESDTLYNIVFSLEDLADVNSANTAGRLFPLSVQPIESPWRIQKNDGSTEIIEFPFSPEALKMINEAESHFTGKRYLQAVAAYQSLLKQFPECYLGYAHLGDTYFVTQQYEKAIECFDKAIAINPLDHRTFFYKADALMCLGRCAEAKTAYIHSLSLRPRYPFALANLRHYAKTLNIEVRTDLFQPRAVVGPDKNNGVAVHAAKEPHPALWLSYAATKAVWLGEPSHRQQMIRESEYRWSSVEEMEALLNLTATYQSLKQDGKIQADQRLDILADVIETRHLEDFIHYEVASRMCPHIMLTLPEQARQSMREFIAKYVIVSVPSQPVEKGNQTVAVTPTVAVGSDCLAGS